MSAFNVVCMEGGRSWRHRKLSHAATATTYYNDGTGSDPYPSPGGTFPFTATDEQVHAYAVAGTYELVLRIIDDDGGAGEMLLVTVLV